MSDKQAAAPNAAPVSALTRELGGGPLPDLGALDAGDIEALTASLRRARRNQQEQLKRAFEAALGHVPMLLRGPVRKILLP